MEQRDGGGEIFRADTYTLSFPCDRPFVYLDDREGNRLAELFVPAGVQPMAERDDSFAYGEWGRTELDESVVFSLDIESSAWSRKTCRFRCSRDRLVYDVEVSGSGRLAEVTYFGGYCSALPRWGSGFFLSDHRFLQGFNPEPSVEDTAYFDPHGGAVIDLTGAPLPGKRHWFFNPAPFCYAFRGPAGWVGVGIEAAAAANRFTEYAYHWRGGFYLTLAYDGRTEVDGTYALPSVGFDFAATEYDALEAHVASLRSSGNAPSGVFDRPEWWTRPIFCGWGAQCRQAAADHGYLSGPDAEPDPLEFVATLRHAPEYARQDAYESFLSELAAHDLRPGTVVVDDKWQRTYGDNAVDAGKWPDLRGFVDRQHAGGRKVLLWLKAWDCEGLPAEECITNAGGLPLAADPTNPSCEARMRASVHRMLSKDGYDADGFKLDFTHRIPVGPGLSLHGDLWGVELLKRYLRILHDEAQSVKPDALLMTHTPHPYLADVVGMIRLNDMLDLTHLDASAGKSLRGTLERRSRVARIACPEALIDTDNWPVRDRESWREYIRLQPDIGVPSLYFVSHIDLTGEPLTEKDYRLVRDTWTQPIGS